MLFCEPFENQTDTLAVVNKPLISFNITPFTQIECQTFVLSNKNIWLNI